MTRPIIAVVDDEPAVRDITGLFLALGGYDAREFVNGRDFLDRARPPVAAAVLDTHMPVLDGRATLREMRRRRIATPVLVVSGFLPAAWAAELPALGVREYLPKPFRLDALVAAVRRLAGPGGRPFFPRGPMSGK